VTEALAELYLEFATMLEEANRSDNLNYRKALIKHSSDVLDKAVVAWREELAVLRGMFQSLHSAESDRIELAAMRRATRNRRMKPRILLNSPSPHANISE
jgi:hypothetical protein